MDDKILFKNKNFNLLIIGQAISLFGSAIQRFALSLYVLKITGSATLFATAVTAALLPNLILGPISGVVADRFNKRNIMIILDIISTIIVALMILMNNNGRFSLWTIYVSIILFSITSLFYQPAVNAVIPYIVKEEQLLKANSINIMIFTFSNLLGPVIGGIFYGVLGMKMILILNGVSFFVAVIVESFMIIPFIKREVPVHFVKGIIDDLKQGINYVFKNIFLVNLMITALIANIAIYPFFTVGVAYVSKIIFHVSDKQYGLCEGIILFGGIVAPMIVSAINKKIDLAKILYLAIVLSGFGFILIASIVSPMFINIFNSNLIPFILFITVCFLIMVVLTLLNVSVLTMVQKGSPKELIGRVLSTLMTLSTAAVPIGQLVFGMAFDKLKLNSYIYILISAGILIGLSVYIKAANLRVEDEVKVELEA